MTKTELMETYTAEQLAEMVIELQEGKGNKTINISDVQKFQEEYEKVLKESPLEGIMNKITRDILEQKNNAMAMEFTRIICDLLKRYGVYVHCTETKLSEKITHNSIEEKYGIVFDNMDFSQHDKEFADKIEELQSEVDKCQKVYEATKKDCDRQIEEYEKKIFGLEKYAGRLKCSVDRKQDAINQIDGIICELFGIAHNGDIYSNDFKELLREKSAVGKTIADFLPAEPIKVADMLINAEGEYEHNPIVKKISGNDKGTYRIFGISELRQIAEHLLVYCNHNGEAEE